MTQPGGRKVYVTNREREALIAAAALYEVEYEDSEDPGDHQGDIKALDSLLRKLLK